MKNKKEWIRAGAFLLTFIVISLFQTNAWAKITIEGTDEEKKQIQKAIDDIKKSSPKGKNLFNELQARPENVVIHFGKTSDLATADSNEVILNKAALNCLKQINKPGGGGKALEASSLGHTIAHEALGHTLNLLKGKPNGEAVATAVENMIRMDQGLPLQTALSEEKGGKSLIPFSDGSKVDVTDALRKATSTPGGKSNPKLRIQENAFVRLFAGLDDQGLVNMSLDPAAGTQQLALDLAEFGGGVELVNLVSFNALLAQSAESPEFNLEVSNISMAFDSFILGGQPTGTNSVNMIFPYRTSIGNWDFTNSGENFSFAFSGDFLWTNQYNQSFLEDGYIRQSFSGMMAATSDREWSGSATVEGGMYAPVPEPSTLVLLSFGLLGLARFGKRFKGTRVPQ